MSNYTCCILRGFAGSRNYMKNGDPNVMANPLIVKHWAPFGAIVEIGSGFWKTLIFWFCITFSIDPKINKNLQIVQKWSESDAKGGECALPDSCRSTQGRFTGPLRGVLPPATSQGWFLALGPPRKLLFSMPIFAYIFDEIWTTF